MRLSRSTRQMIARAVDHSPLLPEPFISVERRQRLHRSLARLSRSGVPLNVVYDIGANRGDWTRQVRRYLPDAQFVLFEANPQHATALAALQASYHIGVLSSGERDVLFYSTGGTGDSYYREIGDLYDGVVPARVRTTTLDSIQSTHSLPTPDLIKLDTQGSELDILAGATMALSSASLVLVECALVDFNHDAPAVGEILSFLQSHNFAPVDVIEAHHVHDTLAQVDLLFRRSG